MVQYVLQEGAVETRDHATKLTYADVLALPEDNAVRHEIIDGKLYVTAVPITRHQRIVGRLFHALQTYLDTHPIGEVFGVPLDTVLGEHDVVEPDLLYLSHERSQRFLTDKNLQGPPDLVVEILSPSTKSRDLRLKRDLYERTGVLEYWIIDPVKNTITVYRRGGDRFTTPVTMGRDETLTSPILPDFEIILDKLLAN